MCTRVLVHIHVHVRDPSIPPQIKERFQLWKKCVSQVIKEKTMEEVAKQTKTNVSRRVPSSAAGKPAHRSQVKSAKVATPPRKSSRTTDAVHTRV